MDNRGVRSYIYCLPFDAVANALQHHLIHVVSGGVEHDVRRCQEGVNLKQRPLSAEKSVKVLQVLQYHL